MAKAKTKRRQDRTGDLKPVASLRLEPATATARKGSVVQFTATALDEDGNPAMSDRGLAWSPNQYEGGMVVVTEHGRATVVRNSDKEEAVTVAVRDIRTGIEATAVITIVPHPKREAT